MKLPFLLALSLSALALAVACSDRTPMPPTQPTATFVPTPSPVSTVADPRSDSEPADAPEPLREPSPTTSVGSSATPTPEVLPVSTPGSFPTPASNEDWAEASGLRSLQRASPGLGSRIETLSWVADGVSQEEREAVELVISAAMEKNRYFSPCWMDGGCSMA